MGKARQPKTVDHRPPLASVIPPQSIKQLSVSEGKRRMPASQLLPLALVASLQELSRRQSILRDQLLEATELFSETKKSLERLQKRSSTHQAQVADLQAKTRQRLEVAALKMTQVVQASQSEAPEICAEWLTLIRRRPSLMADQDGRAELERFLHTLKATDDPEEDERRPCPPKLLKAIASFLLEADRLPRRCQARVESLSRRVDSTAQLATRSADASARAEKAFDEAAKLEVGVRWAEVRVQECILDLLLLRQRQRQHQRKMRRIEPQLPS